MAQAHDVGFRKAQARAVTLQRPRDERISRTALEKLAERLVDRGLCSALILESKPNKKDKK